MRPPPSKCALAMMILRAAGSFADATPFLMGVLTHYNNQVFVSSLLTDATLDLSFTSTSPVLPALDTFPPWSSDDRLVAYQSALDGDLDIYVFEVDTGITRKLTDNVVADYAPTWLCNSSVVIFTSDVDGNPNLFDAEALSISAPLLDVPTEAQGLTTAPEADIYPENAHREENASREGHLPGLNLGDQTNFLLPDVSVTVVDPSVDIGEAWEPLAVCPVQSPQ